MNLKDSYLHGGSDGKGLVRNTEFKTASLYKIDGSASGLSGTVLRVYRAEPNPYKTSTNTKADKTSEWMWEEFSVPKATNNLLGVLSVTSSSFVNGSTTYTMSVSDGALSITSYTSPSITFAVSGSTTGDNQSNSVEYYSSGSTTTATKTPSNTFYFTIAAKTKKITVDKIVIYSGNNSAATSNYTTITLGTDVAANNSLTKYFKLDSATTCKTGTSSSSITTALKITNTGNGGYAAAVSASKSYTNITTTSGATASSSTTAQYAVLYYTEAGKSLTTKTCKVDSATATSYVSSIYTPFLYYVKDTATAVAGDVSSASKKAPTADATGSNKYTSTFTLAGTSTAKKYAYIAFPSDWGTPSFQWNGNPDNGWEASGVTTTYDNKTYTIYKYSNILASSYTWTITGWN